MLQGNQNTITLVAVNDFTRDLTLYNVSITDGRDLECLNILAGPNVANLAVLPGAGYTWPFANRTYIQLNNCVGTAYLAGQRLEATITLTYFNPQTCDDTKPACHHELRGTLSAAIQNS